ncbi:hypothetical protein P5673_012900 [Acropora cervicornis]|uniref:Uncharacterized protein n=1 Tax=Acropora cervicornis TaxID=6130 RepID=A0AAD9QMC5_ACRCE|nr:hypothetical protein P5673_012900 [Acropora cervicornis]
MNEFQNKVTPNEKKKKGKRNGLNKASLKPTMTSSHVTVEIYNSDNVIIILMFLAAQFLFGLFPIPNSQEIDITFRFRNRIGPKVNFLEVFFTTPDLSVFIFHSTANFQPRKFLSRIAPDRNIFKYRYQEDMLDRRLSCRYGLDFDLTQNKEKCFSRGGATNYSRQFP